MATALFTHPGFLLHDMGQGRPEWPARLKDVDGILRPAGLLAALPVEQARRPRVGALNS